MHRNKHGSKASLNSNDIVVVEEVEDNDISTEAFRIIRKTDKVNFISMHSDKYHQKQSGILGSLNDDFKSSPKTQRN